LVTTSRSTPLHENYRLGNACGLKQSGTSKTGRLVWLVAALALSTLLSACTTTQGVKPDLVHGRRCAYLAPDVCSKLEPVPGKETLRYIAPHVDWSQYKKVMISPITVWSGAKRNLTAEESQWLANYMYQSLVQQVGKVEKIVDEPGPGVLKIQGAFTQVDAAVPVLRTVSMVIPQARALATLKYIATDSYPFVGAAQGELEITDSRTGEVLAAAVDRRIGGGDLSTAAQWQWGDVQNVMDHWASQVANRLVALRQGKTAAD
jgi:hypothetical protein